MDGVTVFIILTLLVILIWLGYHFGYRILDAFSPVKNDSGVILEKEYIPPHSEMISRRVVRSSEGDGFGGATRYDIPAEIQIAEKCILHINLDGRVIVTPVAAKVYDSVSQGDRIFIKYSQGRFSKKIYLKSIKHSQN